MEQFLDSFGDVRQAKLWSDVCERLEDEPPEGDSGMGEFEFRCSYGDILAIEQVDVDDAGGISLVGERSSENMLNAFDFPEKIFGLEFGRKLEHRVQERGRVGRAVDGRGLVNFGAKHGQGPAMETEEFAPSGLKEEKARFDVRPKCNPGTHGLRAQVARSVKREITARVRSLNSFQAKHSLHIVEARRPGSDPFHGAKGAFGEGISTRRFVRQLKTFADIGVEDGMITHDVATAQGM